MNLYITALIVVISLVVIIIILKKATDTIPELPKKSNLSANYVHSESNQEEYSYEPIDTLEDIKFQSSNTDSNHSDETMYRHSFENGYYIVKDPSGKIVHREIM